MTRRRLPRIAALSGPEVARVRHAELHSPVLAGPGALTWTLTLLDDAGTALAESRTASPDVPEPPAGVAQLQLEVAGLRQAGDWAGQGAGRVRASPRYRAPVQPVPPPD